MNSIFSTAVLLTIVVIAGSPVSCKPTDCSNWDVISNKYGAQIFLLGDRSLKIPATVEQMETELCPRLLDASDQMKTGIRKCLDPFPKTVAGLLVRGTRRVIKDKCTNEAERTRIVKYLGCVREQSNLDQLHDLVDLLNRKLVYMGTDAVPVSKRLDLLCCHVLQDKENIRPIAEKICSPEATNYALAMVDDMLKDALDVACGAYISEPEKCKPVLQATPLNVTMQSPKPSDAFFVPLVNVLSTIS